MRRLPFLNGVRAFEAAARTGSFAKAADELHVTPAAISRLVHLLEERLGAELFERKANRLAPTPAGRTYQAGLTPLFDALANLTAQVSAMGGARVLTVGVGPTFAIRWLIRDWPNSRRSRRIWRCALRPAARLRRARRLDLRHHARRRRLAGPCRRTAVHCQPDAGLRAAAGAAAEAAGRPEVGDLAAGHARARGLAALAPGAGLARLSAKGPESEYYGQALQAALDGVGVAIGISPTSTTIFAPADWRRRSRIACRKACTGT